MRAITVRQPWARLDDRDWCQSLDNLQLLNYTKQNAKRCVILLYWSDA